MWKVFEILWLKRGSTAQTMRAVGGSHTFYSILMQLAVWEQSLLFLCLARCSHLVAASHEVADVCLQSTGTAPGKSCERPKTKKTFSKGPLMIQMARLPVVKAHADSLHLFQDIDTDAWLGLR